MSTAVDVTGSREAFVDGLVSYNAWAESYRPANEAAFVEAHRAIVAGDYRETLNVLSRAHGGLQEAMNSDDLPILLGATIRTSLMAAYDQVSSPWRTLVATDSLPDLEQWKRALTLFQSDDQKGNSAPNNLIPEVPEHGMYDEARMSEKYEVAQLRTYGLAWSVTRRMQLADNLGAVNRMSRDIGLAMARTKNWHFVNLIEEAASTSVSGKLLVDGTRLFATAAARGNMASGAYGIAADTLSAQLALFNAQTDRNGLTNSRNGIRAKYLIVPPAKEETAWNIVSPAARITGANATTTSDNYFKFLEVVVIPELTSDVDWYLAADPKMYPGLVYGTLNGVEAPEYFTQLANVSLQEADGSKQKIRHDFGFCAEQWHTWRKIDVTG